MFCRTKNRLGSIRLPYTNRTKLNLLSLEDRLTPSATLYTVTDPADDGLGTLREAIVSANANAGHDTINFDIGSTAISLRSQLEITDEITITGPDEDRVSITRDAGTGKFRLFEINVGIGEDVKLNKLLMSWGLAEGEDGGCIRFHEADLFLEDVEIYYCEAHGGRGGAVAGEGRLDIVRGYIHNNWSSGENIGAGGAIFLVSNGVNGALRMEDSTIADLQEPSFNEVVSGGGIYFEGKVGEAGFVITNSSIVENQAIEGDGGAIALNYVDGEVLIQNSSIGENGSTDSLKQNDEVGGGIYIAGCENLTLKVRSTILAENQEANYVPGPGGPSEIIASNIVVKGWDMTWQIEAEYCLFGPLESNLMISGSNNIFDSDPLFLGLVEQANNYVQVPVMVIDEASPARNAGYNFANVDFDQRDDPFKRDDGNGTDIGSYEYQL